MTDNIKDIYSTWLEWEFSDFPLIINELEFENNNWNFDKSSFIEISRGNDFTFRTVIKGYVSNFKNLDGKNDFIGKGNIIEDQKIKGKGLNGEEIVLKGCLNGEMKTDSANLKFVEAGLYIESLSINKTRKKQKDGNIRLEWFVCRDIPSHAHLWGHTRRNPEFDNKKIRIGIDEYDDTPQNMIGGSSSSDYSFIDLKNIKFILAKVPKSLLPEGYEGICIESRENYPPLSDEILNGIIEFLSFLLGNKLIHTGNSLINNQELIEANLFSCNISKSGTAMPPIQLNFKYEWGDITKLLIRYLPEYLDKRTKIGLKDALSRYWISKETPIGANLPVLASALEIINHNFIKDIDQELLEYLPKAEYQGLIKEELDSIKIKLDYLPAKEKQIIINKISGAYQKGSNEKMRILFDKLGLETGKVEDQAIRLRNSMVHGSRDYSDIEDAYDDLILSRAYEILFHRIMLILIGYTDYYIDYSMQGCPSKPVRMKAGE